MVGPAAKRDAVAHLKTVMGLSERRACQIISADRKMIRYRSCRPPETELRAKLPRTALPPAEAGRTVAGSRNADARCRGERDESFAFPPVAHTWGNRGAIAPIHFQE
ncbi:hypothetical protein IE4872_PC00048 (plasmid) [Rhizobium gallicum]|uniref:Uncharacterized protein n=1 Tax=Rhizobium gallicum TaxID=56730 RepID=A0A1L5NQA1_9HYPH|nr:hypothetical protein IE4872_PC00048 [Rhizobium gallicum]